MGKSGRILMTAAVVSLAGMITAPAKALAEQPLNVLLVTGGGFHDYEAQTEILTDGLSSRINVEITVDMQAGAESDGTTPLHDDVAWAEQYDLILYNACFVHAGTEERVERIISGHVDHEVPAVAIHCSVFFGPGTERWQNFLGARISGHQGIRPFTVETRNPDHPITRYFRTPWDIPDDAEGELYEIDATQPEIEHLLHAYGEGANRYHTVAWVKEHEGVRLFVTTLVHDHVAMATDNYLNLVAAGLLWAADRLDEDGNPVDGAAVDLTPIRD